VGSSGTAGGAGQVTEVHAEAALIAAWDRLERRIAAAVARARESVVALEYTAADAPTGARRVATGVVINHRGEILSVRIDQPPAEPVPGMTNDVVSIVAHDSLGRGHAARWIAMDSATGLTLLQVAARAVRPIRPAADGPKLGSLVFVVGNPFGMGHSVSRGHLAGLDRALALGGRQLGGLIQVQAPLYPGDSGAAVVDLHGALLGLIRGGLAIPVSGSAPDSGPIPGPLEPGPSGSPLPPAGVVELADDLANGASGRPDSDTAFGFAIPTRDALWVAEQLRIHGRVDRAYLGIRLEPVSSALGSSTSSEPGPRAAQDPKLGWTDSRTDSGTRPPPTTVESEAVPATAGDGAMLREVLAGTPAGKAGLRRGDRIVAIDGHPVRSPLDLIDRLGRIAARATIVLSVVRDGDDRRPIEFSVKTAIRSVPPSGSTRSPLAGPERESARASAPTTGTPAASRSAAATSEADTSASRDATLRPAASVSPRLPGADPGPPDRAEAAVHSSTPSLNGPLLSLPRAVAERLRQLERRLEKLETVSAPAPDRGPAPDRHVAPAHKR
jgi:serine protease Do